jgi:hypothetical protein
LFGALHNVHGGAQPNATDESLNRCEVAGGFEFLRYCIDHRSRALADNVGIQWLAISDLPGQGSRRSRCPSVIHALRADANAPAYEPKMAASADTAAGSKERANNAIPQALRFAPAALLLPAAAQRLIELDKRESFIQLRVDQIQLCREIIRFVRQDLQVTRATIPIEDQ